MFNSKFSKEFLGLKDHSLLVFKGWKNQRKIEYLGYLFRFSFLSNSNYFLKYFSLLFDFQNTLIFSHLSLSYLSYLLGSCLVRKDLVCGLCDHLVL